MKVTIDTSLNKYSFDFSGTPKRCAARMAEYLTEVMLDVWHPGLDPVRARRFAAAMKKSYERHRRKYG